MELDSFDNYFKQKESMPAVHPVNMRKSLLRDSRICISGVLMS